MVHWNGTKEKEKYIIVVENDDDDDDEQQSECHKGVDDHVKYKPLRVALCDIGLRAPVKERGVKSSKAAAPPPPASAPAAVALSSQH
ncbi:hypothetical protein PV325_004859 [Microctonus aethiopoides]|nr:hypothetical protein PV325_004859 [Microctonus aethiopoides]